MHSHRVLGGLLLLTLLPATLLVWYVVPATASVIRVPQDCPTIQEAVDVAKPGDTIQVASETYYENVVVSQRVTIVGENNTSTIVDGGGKDIVFNIQANDVEIRQLTIRNGGRRYSGIATYMYGGLVIRDNRISQNVVGISFSESDGNTIEGNVLFDNSMYGISLAQCDSNTVENNSIANSAYGVDLQDSSGSFIVGNTVSDTSYGIYLAYASNNNVSANTLTDNSWNMYLVHSDGNTVHRNVVSGGSVGIEVYWSQGNSVMNNTVADGSYGIYLAHCGANTLAGNTASLNDWGIEFYNSTGSIIFENMISDNTWGAYVVENSDGNSIYHNNFINNVKGAYQDLSSANTWRTSTTPYQGNYWSDYKGEDTDGDGIGETYLPWEGVDYYPLMAPWGVYHDVAIIGVTPSATKIYAGEVVDITVIAENQGRETETFDITAKYENATYGIAEPIGTLEVTSLAPQTNTTLVFTWNTTGVTPSRYTISAEATPLGGEVEVDDNLFTDGVIHVKIPGDINGDGIVEVLDVGAVSAHWYPGPPLGPLGYNADADINNDGAVDIFDAAIVSANWLKSEGP